MSSKYTINFLGVQVECEDAEAVRELIQSGMTKPSESRKTHTYDKDTSLGRQMMFLRTLLDTKAAVSPAYMYKAIGMGKNGTPTKRGLGAIVMAVNSRCREHGFKPEDIFERQTINNKHLYVAGPKIAELITALEARQ